MHAVSGSQPLTFWRPRRKGQKGRRTKKKKSMYKKPRARRKTKFRVTEKPFKIQIDHDQHLEVKEGHEEPLGSQCSMI